MRGGELVGGELVRGGGCGDGFWEQKGQEQTGGRYLG